MNPFFPETGAESLFMFFPVMFTELFYLVFPRVPQVVCDNIADVLVGNHDSSHVIAVASAYPVIHVGNQKFWVEEFLCELRLELEFIHPADFRGK